MLDFDHFFLGECVHQRGGTDDEDDVLKLPPIDSKMYLLAQPMPSPARPSAINEYFQPKVECASMNGLLIAVLRALWDLLDACTKSNKPVFVFVLVIYIAKRKHSSIRFRSRSLSYCFITLSMLATSFVSNRWAHDIKVEMLCGRAWLRQEEIVRPWNLIYACWHRWPLSTQSCFPCAPLWHQILESDVDPNGVDYNGQSPLLVSVMRNNADMAKLLMRYGT